MAPHNQHQMSLGNLDHVEEQSFEPIPVGTYQVRAIAIELKDTKNGEGQFIAVEFEVVGDRYASRRIFENYNVVNNNSQTVEIALRQIKGWLAACGQDTGGELTLERIYRLEGVTCWAKVGIEKDKGGVYDDKNRVKRFIAVEGEEGAARPSQPPTQQAAPPQTEASPAKPASPGKRPWQ